MSDPSFACQDAAWEKLTASPGFTAYIPATQILDSGIRPEEFPALQIGAGQTVLETVTLERKHVRVFLPLEIWTSNGSEELKAIAAQANAALKGKPTIPGFHVLDWIVTRTQFMRDPDNNVGHAIIALEALLCEAA